MSAAVLQEMPLDTQAVNTECKGFIFTTAKEKGRGGKADLRWQLWKKE